MSHMVIFNGAEGQPRYHQAETLEDAVKFAEHLRNAEDLDETKIYRLSEVSFEFRPYFRVEVGASVEEAAASDTVPDDDAEDSSEDPVKDSAEEPEKASVDKEPETADENDSPFEFGSDQPAKASRIFSRS